MADKVAPYGLSNLVGGNPSPGTRVYTVQLPGGDHILIEGPDGATDDQLIAVAKGELARQRPQGQYAAPVVDHSNRLGLAKPQDAGFSDVLSHAATFGLDDEAQGATSALVNAVKAPFSDKVDFDPIGAYNYGAQGARNSLAAYEKENPGTSLTGSILGGFANAPGRAFNALEAAPTALGRIWQASKIGAGLGALQGFGNGEGTGRIGSTIAGGIGGGVLGGGLHLAGTILAPLASGVQRLFSPNNGLAVQRVAEAMASDNLTPQAAGSAMDAARANGVPAMLADQGENLQRLLGAVRRQPGDGRTMISNALRDRQLGSYDRVSGAISRDLGPIDNVNNRSDQLIQQARAAAAPLYDAAYAAPGVASDEITSLLGTPAGQQALGRARRIAANERLDPTRLGVDLDGQGNPILTRVPTMQTLDYAKRGLDDIIEQYRDPVTRRLNLDEAGRAVNGVKNQLLTEMDRLNPDYAAARQAYAGPARERDALYQGSQAVNRSAGDIDRQIANMSDSERQQFALGMRSKLDDMLSRRTDGGDKVGALLGTPQRRDVLQRAAGPDADFQRFTDTMDAERAAGDTYRIAMTGSPTAINMNDDAMVGDAGIVSDAANRFIRTNGGLVARTANALAPLLDVGRFGAGRTGDRVRQGIASLLVETDPGAYLAALDGVQNLNAQRALRAARIGRLGLRASGALGNTAGSIIGQALPQPQN